MSLCINTFGGLSVTRDGAPLGGAAAQPRRLAVLAMLARAGSRGVTREKLIAALWPDADEEQGRKLLTQALYTLRRDLGDEDAITGLKELRLDQDRVTTDVGQFASAIAEGALERAASLYGGAFLDGFHLPAAPEFERWAERERDAIALEYQDVLERLARDASARGDTGAAASWWKRLAAQDPLNARLTMELMRALVDAGDVRGALRQAQIYEALIEQELELPPDRDVVALAQTIRARREDSTSAPPPTTVMAASPATEAPKPDAAMPTPTVVAEPSEPIRETPKPLIIEPAERTPMRPSVAFRRLSRRRVGGALIAGVLLGGVGVAALLARTSGPRQAAADESRPVVAIARIADHRVQTAGASNLGLPIADMLATNLARTPGLRVLSAARVHEVARQLGGSADSLGVAPTAARQAGATELVDGALFALADGSLRLDLRRVNARTGDVLGAHTITGRDAFALVDSGTARLVRDYGARAPAGSVADVTTRSLAAYRLYEEGLRAYYRSDRESAARLFDAALREDSTFAMAALYGALSTTEDWRRVLDLLDRAMRLAGRASDRERLIIKAEWANTSSSPALAAIAETLATRYPDEVAGHLYRGIGLERAGRYLESVAPFERVVRMDSLAFTQRGPAMCSACRAIHLLVFVYELTDSLAARERVARRWVRLQPHSHLPWVVMAGSHALAGRYAEAEAAWKRAIAADPHVGTTNDFDTWLMLRKQHYAGAEQRMRAQLDGPDVKRHQNARWMLTIILRHQGRMQESMTYARAYRAAAKADRGMGPTGTPGAAILEAIALLDVGRPREAAALFESIGRYWVKGLDDGARSRNRTWNSAHAANAYAHAGDTAGVRRLMDTTRIYGVRSNFVRDHRLHHHVHGVLLAMRGQHAEAAAAFERARFSRGVPYSRTSLEHARALLRVNRPREAIDILQPTLRAPYDGISLYATHTELEELLAAAWDQAGGRDSARAHWRNVARSWARGDASFRRRALEAARRAED